MRKKFYISSQQGAVPLLLLILILVLVGGGGFALLQLADPACRDNLRECLIEGIIRIREDEYNPGKRRDSPSTDTNSSMTTTEQAKFTGTAIIRIELSQLGYEGGDKLNISFDQKTISGRIYLRNQGVSVALNTNGTVDPDSGAITASVSGQSTQNVSQGKFSGSATVDYSGQLTGTVNEVNRASGNLVLTQKIVSVSGNIPGLSAGKTDTLTISWTGDFTKAN